MKSTVTQEQIASYQRDGFVLHRGFLSPAEVAELKAAVLDSVASMGKRKLAKAGEEWDEKGDNYYDKVFTQRINLWRINDTVKRYMLNPALGKAICQLAGVDGMRVWHDQTLIKEPYGNPTSWHIDNPYWSFTAPASISIWIALEDATLENGCMWFVPGSHKLTGIENVTIGMNMADLFKANPALAEVDPVSAPMKAGDCSFHSGVTAHGAGANMTRKRRIAMTCGYMPDGSTFNGKKNILPEPYFKSLKIGDVLNNDEQNPLVYSSKKPELAAV